MNNDHVVRIVRWVGTSYDSRPRSHSAPRLRSGSVASTMSVSSRRSGGRGGQSSHGGENNHGHQNLPSLKNLRKQLRSHYNEKVMAMVARYIDEMELNAEIVNNINYLRRCRHLGIIPKEYWMVSVFPFVLYLCYFEIFSLIIFIVHLCFYENIFYLFTQEEV